MVPDLSFRQIGIDLFQKWNPVLGIRTTMKVERGDNGKPVRYHVRHEQPRQLISAVLERNVAMQNDGRKTYGGALITQQASIPLAIHAQIMKQCGFQAGHGYDQKKFRQILNDRDNYKLRCIDGRI